MRLSVTARRVLVLGVLGVFLVLVGLGIATQTQYHVSGIFLETLAVGLVVFGIVLSIRHLGDTGDGSNSQVVQRDQAGLEESGPY